ncbi:hypothetical protein CUC43_12560 [Bacillus thuringiensis LM1212]|uniref:hypothetical protein n=1 Tax=Bacillus cereus group TaxID=86661 RepID=UPI0004144730|nr:MULTISPECIES: hypothetical protein [Bacillus cereus group]AXY07625.1 hypothetical protein CUC43_12560 [Bacillus thuringiensis LM1212]QDF26002.1 hypothetical protein FJR70_24895 [Bacillus tropicus]QUG93941.1 hypothetical protein HCM98_02825 [Bacillus tropicus]
MIYIISSFFLLIVIGFIRQINTLNQLQEDANFLVTFNNNYVEYLNNYLTKPNSPEGNSLFNYLIKNSQKSQELLGKLGYIDYRPAFENHIIKSYPLLVNTIPSLRSNKVFDSLSSLARNNPIDEEFLWVHNHLMMRIGYYEERENKVRKEIRNPFILLKEGVQFIVTLPIALMYWTGLIKYSTLTRVSDYFIFKFLNFLIIIIGFLSAIVTLVTGWEPFMKILSP